MYSNFYAKNGERKKNNENSAIDGFLERKSGNMEQIDGENRICDKAGCKVFLIFQKLVEGYGDRMVEKP